MLSLQLILDNFCGSTKNKYANMYLEACYLYGLAGNGKMVGYSYILDKTIYFKQYGWVDDLRFYVLFNSISVISGQ